MPISLVREGKVLDWHFKKAGDDGFIHNFYTGGIYQGQVFNMGKSWSACPGASTPIERRMLVDGFRTRYDAAKFILDARYHYTDRLNELDDIIKHIE